MAFAELKSLCGAGKLEATALLEGRDLYPDVTIIPSTDWSHLEPYEPDGIHFGNVDGLRLAGSAIPKYWNVKFFREDVIALFSTDDGKRDLRASKNPSKATAIRRLDADISNWIKGGKVPRMKTTRRQFEERGIEEYPCSSTNFWREIWDAKRPLEWAKPGPTGPRT